MSVGGRDDHYPARGTGGPSVGEDSVAADVLREVVSQWCGRVGFSIEDAQNVAAVIVDADVSGVHSHGVRLLAGLIPEIESGTISPTARPRFVVDEGSTAVLDGCHAFGPVACLQALDHVTERCRNHGIAAIAIRNSSHWGRPAYYGRVAAQRGVVLIAISNSAAAMPLWGAVDKSVGNNPLVIAVPREGAEPLVLDVSMQTAAWNRVKLHRDAGERLPTAWGYARDGTLTDDPAELLASGRMRPMGDHKGSGLAVVFEMLTAGLSGGLHSVELTARMEAGDHQFKSQLFIAIDPDRFSGAAALERVVRSYAESIADLEPVPGTAGPRLPGEGSAAARAHNLKHGIQLTPELESAVAMLRGVA